jgi:hypothetical protein
VEEDDNGNAPLFFGGDGNSGKENIDIDDNASAFDALWEGEMPSRIRDGCDNDDESLFGGGGSSEAKRMEKAA